MPPSPGLSTFLKLIIFILRIFYLFAATTPPPLPPPPIYKKWIIYRIFWNPFLMMFERLRGKGGVGYLINELMTKLLVEQPRLHRVC